MISVPILRAGRPYYSKETVTLGDYATRQPIAEVSQANPGLISRDLSADPWPMLQGTTTAEVLTRMASAADVFMNADLPAGDSSQTPRDFVAAQSATTGLPWSLCRQNMTKIASAMRHMGAILDGLTGGLPLETLDAGYGERGGHMLSFAPARGGSARCCPPIPPGSMRSGCRRWRSACR